MDAERRKGESEHDGKRCLDALIGEIGWRCFSRLAGNGRSTNKFRSMKGRLGLILTKLGRTEPRLRLILTKLGPMKARLRLILTKLGRTEPRLRLILTKLGPMKARLRLILTKLGPMEA